MSRWFRHYAGMMRDDKLVRVALRSKQPIERVCWVWGAILESAAEIDDEGRYDVDAAEVAYFLRAAEDDIDAVLAALTDAGRVADGRVVKWGNRQFSSDRSKERVAAHRQRKRQAGGDGEDQAGDGGVTLQKRHGDAPETETELETDNPPKPPRKRRGEGKTKIPEDWSPPPVSDLTPRAKACAEQWTSSSYATVAEGFVCYWRRTGKLNTDWRLTWCEWVIRDHAKVMRDQKFGNAAPSSDAGRKLSQAERAAALEERARGFEQIGRHDRAEEARTEARRLSATGPPRSIGQLADGIVAGVGNGQA